MGEPTRKHALFGDITIAYDSYGQGDEALVFIHGWTCDRLLWRFQTPIFQNHRSIVIDLPGHGESDAPQCDYSQEFFARSIQAVLQAERIQRAILVAHSLGGPMSTMFLRLYTEFVVAILYVDSFFFSPSTYRTMEERKKVAKQLESDELFVGRVNDFFASKTTDTIREEVTKTMLKTPRHVRVSANATNSLPHAFRWTECYDIPALNIASSIFANVDQYWSHHLPQLQIQIWEGPGHFLFMEEPERFNREVENFLAKNNLMTKRGQV